MDERLMDDMSLELVLPLYKWLGLKRILRALAKLELRESHMSGKGFEGAKYNAALLEDTARMLGE